VLSALREMTDKAIAEGMSIQEFRQQFREMVGKTGWTGWAGEGTKEGVAWRTRVIYQTNLRTAYAAGRYAQMKEMAKTHPFWMYRHGGSIEPRLNHLAIDGKVMPADDPFWDIHYPPNGWGCSCYVVAKSLAGLKRAGKTNPDGTPEVGGIPPNFVKIDKGWDYNIGEAAFGSWDREKYASFSLLEEGKFETWQSLGLVQDIPVEPLKTKIPEDYENTEEHLRKAIDDVIGKERLMVFEKEGIVIPVLINGEQLLHHFTILKEQFGGSPDYNRGKLIYLLPEMIANPFEIWAQFKRSPSGKVLLDYEFIRGFDMEGSERRILFVAKVVNGQMSSSTIYIRKQKDLNKKSRLGLLLYKRPAAP
jgi:hypothetical protein